MWLHRRYFVEGAATAADRTRTAVADIVMLGLDNSQRPVAPTDTTAESWSW